MHGLHFVQVYGDEVMGEGEADALSYPWGGGVEERGKGKEGAKEESRKGREERRENPMIPCTGM